MRINASINLQPGKKIDALWCSLNSHDRRINASIKLQTCKKNTRQIDALTRL